MRPSPVRNVPATVALFCPCPLSPLYHMNLKLPLPLFCAWCPVRRMVCGHAVSSCSPLPTSVLQNRSELRVLWCRAGKSCPVSSGRKCGKSGLISSRTARQVTSNSVSAEWVARLACCIGFPREPCSRACSSTEGLIAIGQLPATTPCIVFVAPCHSCVTVALTLVLCVPTQGWETLTQEQKEKLWKEQVDQFEKRTACK